MRLKNLRRTTTKSLLLVSMRASRRMLMVILMAKMEAMRLERVFIPKRRRAFKYQRSGL